MEDKKEVKKMEAEAPEALDTEELDQVAGGVGNPFDRPRMGYKPIDDDLRGNG